MNEMLKYLIIITLCYYLVKIIIYLLLWQATKKVEEKARERLKKRREKIHKDSTEYAKQEDNENKLP